MLAIQGGTVHSGGGDVWENATVLIKKGKILAVGADVEVPEGAKVMDASGRHVFPGLIDADSRLLVDPSAYGTGGTSVTLDIVDALDAYRLRVVEDAWAQGVTAVGVAPQGGGMFHGTEAVLKLRAGAAERVLASGGRIQMLTDSSARATSRLKGLRSLEKELKATSEYIDSWDEYEEKLEEYTKELEKLRKKEEAAEGEEDGGDKKGKKGRGDKDKKDKKDGEPPKPDEKGEEEKEEKDEEEEKEEDKSPSFFQRVADEFADRRPARGGPPPKKDEGDKKDGDKKDGDKKEEEEKGPEKPKKPQRNANRDVLRKALEGDLAVRARVHGAADILNILAIQENYPLRLTLSGCAEAHRVADEIKEAGVPVILTVSPTDPENREAAAVLAEHGIDFALSTPGGSAAETRFLSMCAAAAVAGGLSKEDALAAVTSRAAAILGVSDRIGSLAPGKDADVVIASGAPFAASAKVERVLVDGEVVYGE
jgi:hypothetical protein